MDNFANPLHQIIYEQVVRPAMSQKKSMVVGTVVSYDHTKNTATVEIPSRHGKASHRLANIPVQTMGGLKFSGPFKGDHVWISFADGNIHQPHIVSFADHQYNSKTREQRHAHETKGAYVPDMICRRN